MKSFDIVVATELTRGIGKSGAMPWSLPEDLQYFKHLTATASLGKQNMVIMGRRTWESLPENYRPLPGRVNAVITTYPADLFPESVRIFSSLELALEWAEGRAEIDRCFVVGGGQLYAEAIMHPWLDRLYLTLIHQVCDCDTFFPDYTHRFKRESSSGVKTSKAGVGYQFDVFKA